MSAVLMPRPAAAQRLARLVDRAPRHRSRRIKLRPLAVDDAEPLWQATRNPAFNAFLTWPQPAQRSELDERVSRMVAQARARHVCLLSAVDIASERWVGLYRIEPDPVWGGDGWFELGMWVHPDFWGGGYAGELHAIGTALAFQESDAPGLAARTAVANPKGWKTLEHMGFKRTAEYEEPSEGGPPIPALAYCLLRGDWEQAMAVAAAA